MGEERKDKSRSDAVADSSSTANEIEKIAAQVEADAMEALLSQRSRGPVSLGEHVDHKLAEVDRRLCLAGVEVSELEQDAVGVRTAVVELLKWALAVSQHKDGLQGVPLQPLADALEGVVGEEEVERFKEQVESRKR